MNAPHLRIRRQIAQALALVGAGLALAATAAGQEQVTGITYGNLTNGANVTVGNLTYRNDTYSVSTVSTSSGNYSFTGPLASAVSFRRNTGAGNPNTSTVFYQYATTSGSTASVYAEGDNSPTLSEVMLSNDLSQGLRNPFANGSSSNLNSNIERIDFYFAGGYTVQAGDSLVFFDLENAGNYGDGFRIAAYNSVGPVNGFTNAPNAYVNTGLLIGADTFGSPVNAPGTSSLSSATYLRSTTTNGDNLSASQSLAVLDSNSSSASNLYLVGILIPLADLGLSVGQTIYGYSLFAGDVAFTSTSQMNNWNNASYYPTNTDPTSWGNMDFMGFGAQLARPVPEPSTYGALLLAAGVALAFWRRQRRAALRA